MVEEMLAARGICVTYETVRQWGKKFGKVPSRFMLELTGASSGDMRLSDHAARSMI